jgi:acetyl esterase/lipase
LLTEYERKNIGIYGCSAGGTLTAEAVAWFVKEGLPAPGAVGMFCAGAVPSSGSDSEHVAQAISGARSSATAKPSDQSAAFLKEHSYFREEDLKNPLAFPGLDQKVMARFPDSHARPCA